MILMIVALISCMQLPVQALTSCPGYGGERVYSWHGPECVYHIMGVLKCTLGPLQEEMSSRSNTLSVKFVVQVAFKFYFTQSQYQPPLEILDW